MFHLLPAYGGKEPAFPCPQFCVARQPVVSTDPLPGPKRMADSKSVFLLTSGSDQCKGNGDPCQRRTQRAHTSSHHAGVGQVLQTGKATLGFPLHVCQDRPTRPKCSFPFRCLVVSPCYCGLVPSSVSWLTESRLQWRTSQLMTM